MSVSIKELCMRAEIMDVVHAYAEAVDTKDWKRWSDCFTPDAYIDYTSSGGSKGTVTEMFACESQKPFPQNPGISSTFKLFSASQHMLSNFQFDFYDVASPGPKTAQKKDAGNPPVSKCKVTVKLYNPM
eukprot:gene25750-32697_t